MLRIWYINLIDWLYRFNWIRINFNIHRSYLWFGNNIHNNIFGRSILSYFLYFHLFFNMTALIFQNYTLMIILFSTLSFVRIFIAYVLRFIIIKNSISMNHSCRIHVLLFCFL